MLWERPITSTQIEGEMKVVPDLIEFNTVLVAPGIQPGAVSENDFARLGKPVDSEQSVRTPVLTMLRFPQHNVRAEDPRLQLTATQPSLSTLELMSQAAREFVEERLGRRSVTAVGHNLTFRRRHPGGYGPTAFFGKAIHGGVTTAFESTKDVEVSLEVVFSPAFCTRAKARIEPSRVDDLEAIWIHYNYHFDLSDSEDRYSDLLTALDMTAELTGLADQTTNRLLTGVLPEGDKDGS